MRVHQLVDDGLGRRIGEQIVVFGGIVEHVEQLAGLAGVLVDHEPVPLGLEHREAPVLADRERARRQCSRRVTIDVTAERPTLAGSDRGRAAASRTVAGTSTWSTSASTTRGSQPRGGRMISGTRTACW